jgi:hypothetical protein
VATRRQRRNSGLTMLFADLVDSTALSTRIAPEMYRTVIGRYREQVRQTQLVVYSLFMVEPMSQRNSRRSIQN